MDRRPASLMRTVGKNITWEGNVPDVKRIATALGSGLHI